VAGLRQGRSEARETCPIQPVEDQTVEATLVELSEVVAGMVRFQRLTGCRPAEVCALRPCDLDRSGEVWVFTPASHKTEQRLIPVGPRAQALLFKYLARDGETHCFRPCDSEAKRYAALHSQRQTPLSCGNRPGTNRVKCRRRPPGKQYQVPSYRRAIHYACDQVFPHPELGKTIHHTMTEHQIAELKAWQSAHRWSPNQLRHAAATEFRSKFGLEVAQVILGHASADVTQVYAERDLAKDAEVARQIG